MRIRIGNEHVKLKDMARMCGGKLSLWGKCGNPEIRYICTDSHEVESGDMFVALHGENADGHQFIPEVIQKGATCVLCEKEPKELNFTCQNFALIRVKDTLKALASMANEYKKGLPTKTIAITGSVGKTTTKEMVSAVLSQNFEVNKTIRNFNSLVGMPLSVMELSDKNDCAVFEMGMSELGEISIMSQIAKPDIAIITVLGSSHLDTLGTMENVAKAKMEIADGLKKDGILLINGEEPLLEPLKQSGRDVRTVAFDHPEATFNIISVEHQLDKSTFTLVTGGKNYENIEIPFQGKPGILAAAYAFAVGLLLKVPEETIREQLRQFKNVTMRQSIYEYRGVTIIEDCYNASPESVKASLEALQIYASNVQTPHRLLAVLGDVRGLGEENAAQLHHQMGLNAASAGLDYLFTFGPRSEQTAIGAIEGGIRISHVSAYSDLEHPEAVGEMVVETLQPGDIILFKASRKVALERVIEYVKNHATSFFKSDLSF